MDKTAENKRIDNYFKSYPDADVMYFTNDGMAFISRKAAIDHANNLKLGLKEVERKKRKGGK